MVTAAAFHPLHHELACGFESGRLRVFDVPTTMLVQEHAQHRGPLVELVYSPCGTRLHSGAMDGTLVVYDVLQVYAPVKFLSAGVRDIKVRACFMWCGAGQGQAGKQGAWVWPWHVHWLAMAGHPAGDVHWKA